MRALGAVTFIALIVAVAAAAAGPAPQARARSAAYWRDMCTGQQIGIPRAEQDRMCLLYLSSFHDAVDEYREAGYKIFCPPDTMSAEGMRRDFLVYMADIHETAEFFPAGRALLLALMRAHPCTASR
ncbi:MAG: Rap1a/Tai family immunity protein [Xanthobacteraceae bacterium]